MGVGVRREGEVEGEGVGVCVGGGRVVVVEGEEG